MKRLMLTLFACSIAACGLEPGDQTDDETLGTEEESIIGGTTDTGDACVVGVFAHLAGSTSGSICTGTIIGPHTVLTAAHCVSPASIGSGRQIDLLIGTTLSGAPRIATSSRTFNPQWNINNLGACHDEGILHTTQTLSPICGRGALNTSTPPHSVRGNLASSRKSWSSVSSVRRSCPASRKCWMSGARRSSSSSITKSTSQ